MISVIVVDSWGGWSGAGDPNAPPPIAAEELRRQLTPGLRAVFGVPMRTSFVPQAKSKKGEKE